MVENVVWLDDVSMSDVDKVGGKNASLGENDKAPLAHKALESLVALQLQLKRSNHF